MPGRVATLPPGATVPRRHRPCGSRRRRLRGILRIVLIVIACGFGLYLAWRIRTVILLAVISLFLALAMVPAVDAVERRVRMPRAVIILVGYVLLAIAVVVIGYVVIPSTVKEIHELARNAAPVCPRAARELHLPPLRQPLPHHPQACERRAAAAAAARTPGRPATAGDGLSVQLHRPARHRAGAHVPARPPRQRVRGLGLSLTGRREARYRRLIRNVNNAVAKYTLGNIAISVLATVATWVVLTILGVPYALSLGFVVGFF